MSDKFEEMFETYFGSLRKIKGSISFGAIATKKDILNFWQAAQANARADVEKAVLDERKRIAGLIRSWSKQSGDNAVFNEIYATIADLIENQEEEGK